MTNPPGRTPPLSPVLLAGLLIRPLPLALLQPLASLAATMMWRQYPAVFERLAPLGDKAIRIDPEDLPVAFLLRPGLSPPQLHIIPGSSSDAAAATIRGPLLALIALLEGRVDGDALFFSRDLIIEGDTEAVLTLRNAVDDAEIKIEETLFEALGRLAPLARLAAKPGKALFNRMTHDLKTLQAALIAPAIHRSDRLSAKLAAMEAEITASAGRRRSGRAAVPNNGSLDKEMAGLNTLDSTRR